MMMRRKCFICIHSDSKQACGLACGVVEELKYLSTALRLWASRIEILPVELLDVLEAFEVEAQNLRYLLDLHPLLSFLQALTGIAEKFVLCIQCLCGAAKKSKTSFRVLQSHS